MDNMQKYYGTKLVAATPMSRLEYNIFRGWKLPDNENGTDAGYLVEYLDGGKPNVDSFMGYVSWSPYEQFEKAYQPTNAMSFGHAVEALKAGKKVARSGWNGKGMFLYYVPANSYPAQTDIAKKHWGADAKVPYRAYIAMKTVDDDVQVWTASQTDILSNDWSIIE